MKKTTLITITITILLASTLFINLSNATNQTTYTLQSNGTINQVNNQTSKQEFLIRYIWIGSLTTAAEVNEFVANHPWGTGIILTDLSSGILSIISYNGWNASQTWQDNYGGITYNQLKIVIDEFHKLGWKVIYSPGNTPTNNDRYIYDYLTEQHPELISVAGNGLRFDHTNNKYVMVNFFANYTTPDLKRNINTGDRLSDVYIQRLEQMVIDGSFEWDGWFGIDGWNGFTNQGMYWVWSTNQPFGRWIGTNDLSNWFYGDTQSVLEWSLSSYAKNLPNTWNSYTTIQKVEWITNNANLEWWQFWQERFAIFYAQINQIFDNHPIDRKVGTIIAQDLSSTWADNGINNPTGMENLTMFEQYNSFNHYYIDCEWWGNLDMAGRYSAYVAGLVKSKIPGAHCISQMPIAYSGKMVMPTWVWKQMYLAMIETYIWNNGIRYRAVDPDWLLVWAPTSTNWNDIEYNGQEMANWVKTIANTLNNEISPIWLGPVEVQPLYLSVWSSGPFSVNFTFAQFTDALNLNNTGNNFIPEMNTVFFDAVGSYGNSMGNVYQDLLDLFSDGSLNIIYSSYRYQANFGNTIFMGQGDKECMEIFHLSKKLGSFLNATTLSSDQVTDIYAREIIGDTFDQTYSGYQWAGSMENTSGMIPLIKYNDGPLQLGILYNQTTGRFLYGNSWGGLNSIVNDRSVLNRAIYWASDCPIVCSDSLADLKIFRVSNSEIAISLMNLRDNSQDLQLTLNITGLGLDESKVYRATWISSGTSVNINNLNSINLTLADGADILKIYEI